MGTDIQQGKQYPITADGRTRPLTTFLGSQDLAKHRATLAVELEVLAYKFDRFGWDRDRGTAVQDRLIGDWMDALQDYPLSEVREACRACVASKPNRMPNEGHIKAQIEETRSFRFPPVVVARKPVAPVSDRKPCPPEVAAELVRQFTYRAKSFPSIGDGKDD